MNAWMRLAWTALLIVGVANHAQAQTAKQIDPPPESKYPPPPAPTVIAATVNGQDIPELAVYRGLLRFPAPKWKAARTEILNYLIDNTLVDQYLGQLKIPVEPKEVDDRFAQIVDEAIKDGRNIKDILNKLHLTEPELRKELHAALRWDKFVLQQGTDKVLRDYFQKNTAMFDGSQVQARHILIAAKDDAEAQTRIATLKKGIEEAVAKELANVPSGADKLTVEKERIKANLTVFAAVAERESTCPSSKQGGDLGWFRRVGDMVEPFARTAFALQPFQLSDAVKSEFGYHLILTVERKAGREVSFDDAKNFVAEIYGERLREAILTSYKPRSKIEIKSTTNGTNQ